jgi:hypothetical protein
MSELDTDPSDSIPTLVHLVVPGDPQKVTALQTTSRPASGAGRESSRSHTHSGLGDDKSTRPGFRASIETMIDEVLKHHLAEAREEITSRVIAEIVSRLPQNKP